MGVYKGDFDDNSFFDKSDPPANNPFFGVCIAVNCEHCWNSTLQELDTTCVTSDCPECNAATSAWNTEIANNAQGIEPYWDNVLWDDLSPPATGEPQAFYIWNSQCMNETYQTVLPTTYDPTPDFDYIFNITPVSGGNDSVSPPNSAAVRVDPDANTAALLPGLQFADGVTDGVCYNSTHGFNTDVSFT